MSQTLLESIVILLAIVVLITTVFRRFNIPSIVGYILVGIVAGPHVLAWISADQGTRDLAEYGVVFLLFSIGLEFSLSKLIAMKNIVFGTGSMQVLITIFVTMILGYFLGNDLSDSFIVGAVIAMSSTAIVTKQLVEQYELSTQAGLNSMGILLFQDLAVIPLLILVPTLALHDHFSFATSLFWALIKGVLAIIFILSFGHWVLRPLFTQITKRYSLELLTLAVLFIALSAALLTEELGLSLSLGAFFAGIMLGETEFRHQIEATISPFRDVLLALFFISIGMQVNISMMIGTWWKIILLLFFIIFAKTAIIYAISRFNKLNRVNALRTGLILAQAGEFGFVILILALRYHILLEQTTQIILAAMLLSMLISPILIQHNKAISKFIFRRTANNVSEDPKKDFTQQTKHLHDHIVICGYGRVGQNIARLLESFKVPYIAFDLDTVCVKDANLAGDVVFYGDTTNYHVLETAHISRAKALVISFNDLPTSIKILQSVRAENKKIPILVRVHDDSESNILYEYGATEVIPELTETSLIFASHVLVFMKLPLNKVHQLIEKVRQERYGLLTKVFPGVNRRAGEKQVENALHVISLQEDAFAVGRKIIELQLHKYNVSIIRVRRGSEYIFEPKKEFMLHKNDVVILYGGINEMNQVEKLLISGKLA